jgi:hypothetical protein
MNWSKSSPTITTGPLPSARPLRSFGAALASSSGAILLAVTLSGCDLLDAITELFTPTPPQTVIACPPELAAIPEAAIDALAATGDPAVDQWLVDLTIHYRDQDTLRPRCQK